MHHNNVSATGIRIPQALPSSLEMHCYTEIVKENFCEGVRAENGRKQRQKDAVWQKINKNMRDRRVEDS